MKSTITFILAGGRGKRMDILCDDRSKPTLPFAGSKRVIDFVLSNCLHSQLKDISVLTDYQRLATSTYLKKWLLENGKSCKLNILEPKSNYYAGTADAVFQNLQYIQNHSGDLVLVLAGDHIYKMDYRKMLAFHRHNGADATVGVIQVPIEIACRFGIVTIDGKRKIVNFVEKPKNPQSNLVSMGIYVFNKKVLMEHLIEDSIIPDSLHDFGHAVLPSMVTRNKVFAYKFEGYWRDIGTPQAYYESNMEFLLPKSSLSLNSTWPILTAADYVSPSKQYQQSRIENSLISPGCIIKGRVKNSILSPNVYVEEKAEVRNSIVMANSVIGYHSVIDQCILDEKVNVGDFCYLGFEHSPAADGWKVTMLGKGVNVPSYTAICRSCKVLPQVEADDFSDKVILSNTVLSPAEKSG